MGEKRKAKPIDRLMAAMEKCCHTRGDATWTNGYRAAAKEPEESRLWPKELAQWEAHGESCVRFRRLALQILREVSRAD